MAGTNETASLEAMLKELRSIESGVSTPGERETLRIAAMSLLFIYTKNQSRDFWQYLLESDAPLSDEQIRHLEFLGIRK